jgi:hypothetical protein
MQVGVQSAAEDRRAEATGRRGLAYRSGRIGRHDLGSAPVSAPVMIRPRLARASLADTRGCAMRRGGFRLEPGPWSVRRPSPREALERSMPNPTHNAETNPPSRDEGFGGGASKAIVRPLEVQAPWQR